MTKYSHATTIPITMPSRSSPDWTPRLPPGGSLQYVNQNARRTAVGIWPSRDFTRRHKARAQRNGLARQVPRIDMNLDSRERHLLHGGPRDGLDGLSRIAPPRR